MEADQEIKSSITETTYKLIDNIGSGTFAQCWEAINLTTNQQVCLKIMDYYLMDEYQRESSEKEALLHATLITPSIIKFHEAFFIEIDSSQRYLIIVMDLAVISLDNYLANNTQFFSKSQLMYLFLDIISSLRYLHERELIHRDLSTKNLLIFNNGKNMLSLKLCDFGISTQLLGQNMASTQIGTPHTMSPEIFETDGYNEKVDIWAAGCVFYELFTRKILFQGLNYLALIQALEHFTKPTFDNNLEQHYDISFCAFVMELICLMLDKNTNDRPSSKKIELLLINRLKEMNSTTVIPETELKQNTDSITLLNSFMKPKSNSDSQKIQESNTKLDFNMKPIWIDYTENKFVVLDHAPTPLTQQPVESVHTPRTEVTTSAVTSQTPSKRSVTKKEVKSGLNVSELKKQYKGQNKDFKIEMFTGLSPEVEEQMNQNAVKQKK